MAETLGDGYAQTSSHDDGVFNPLGGGLSSSGSGSGSAAARPSHWLVTVPAGAKPGERVSALTSHGETVQVVVPAGMAEGETFQVAADFAQTKKR